MLLIKFLACNLPPLLFSHLCSVDDPLSISRYTLRLSWFFSLCVLEFVGQGGSKLISEVVAGIAALVWLGIVGSVSRFG